jgi:hypothetical protein
MTFPFICILGLLLLSPSATEALQWSKLDGTRFEAEIVRLEYRSGKGTAQVTIVVFRKADGTVFGKCLAMLSVTDQVQVIKHFQQHVPPPSPRPSPAPQPTPPTPLPPPARAVESDSMDNGKTTTTPVTQEWRGVLEKVREAERQFRGIFADFPAGSLVAHVVGAPEPTRIKNHRVTFRLAVRVAAEESRMRLLLAQLLPVLDYFQQYHWAEDWLFAPDSGKAGGYVRTGVQGENKTVTEDTTVYLCAERNRAWTCLKWRAFGLNQMLADVFGDAAKRQTECVVSAVTKAGDRIPVDRFPLDAERLGGAALLVERTGQDDEGRAFFLSPTFMCGKDCARHVPAVTVSRHVEMPEDWLDRLEGFECKVQVVGSQRNAPGHRKAVSNDSSATRLPQEFSGIPVRFRAAFPH